MGVFTKKRPDANRVAAAAQRKADKAEQKLWQAAKEYQKAKKAAKQSTKKSVKPGAKNSARPSNDTSTAKPPAASGGAE